MRPVDYLKALGLAVLVLAANLLLTTLAIVVYSYFIEPGRPQAFYTEAAPRIGAWTGPAGGVLLMFLAGYVFGRRRPQRNALAFALAVVVAYILIDSAVGLAAAPPAEVLTPRFALSLGLAAVAGLVGAALSIRRDRQAGA